MKEETPDAWITKLLAKLGTDTKKNLERVIPNPHFMETAAEYIEKYEGRLKMFLEQFEANEGDFISQELSGIEGPLCHLELASSDPDTGVTPRYDFNENYQVACYAVHHIGYKKAYYANKKKVGFLKARPCWTRFQSIHTIEAMGNTESATSSASIKGGKKAKSKSGMTNDAKSAFCVLVNDADADKKDLNENIETFTKRICDKYGLGWTDKVRQNYGPTVCTKRNIDKVKNIILPLIPADTAKLINTHIDNTQNLYS